MTQPNDLKPQLKKMDFLKILTSDPTPLAEIKEKLANFRDYGLHLKDSKD